MVLIIGSLGWYITGGIDFKLPDFFSDKDKKTITKPTKNNTSRSSSPAAGKVIDSYKGVKVYSNGKVSNVSGRNRTEDGYNLGLKYQCVEFGKRFFYEAYGHKMPDSYGHAKDFYNHSLPSGSFNKARGMLQFQNGGSEKPRANDMAIIGPSSYNQFGHLIIITKVTYNSVDFIQQNPGAGNPSRGTYALKKENGRYIIDNSEIVGWLRMV